MNGLRKIKQPNKTMGLDVDYIAAKEAIKELEALLFKQGHGNREEIADDILNFTTQMKSKWNKEENDRQS
jgi:hypothetical protein